MDMDVAGELLLCSGGEDAAADCWSPPTPPVGFGIDAGESDDMIGWAGEEEEGGGLPTAAAAAAKEGTGPDMEWSDRGSDMPGPLPGPAASPSCFVW